MGVSWTCHSYLMDAAVIEKGDRGRGSAVAALVLSILAVASLAVEPTGAVILIVFAAFTGVWARSRSEGGSTPRKIANGALVLTLLIAILLLIIIVPYHSDTFNQNGVAPG